MILRALFLALFGAAVGLLGSEMQGLRKLAHGLSSTLADEIDQVEKAEVLVSRTVTDLVAGSGIAFEDRGEHELKGVPGIWRLFAVREC